MSGARVTWSAEVLTWPGVTDITSNLDQAVADLRWSRDIDDIGYDYTPGAGTVTFRLLVRYGITEVVVKGYAEAALWHCLPPAGLGLSGRDVGGHMVANLRFRRWPDAFQWWP